MMTEQDQQQPVKKGIPTWAKVLIVLAVLFVLFCTVVSIGLRLLGGFITSSAGEKLAKMGIEKVIEKGIENNGGKANVDISNHGMVIQDEKSGQKLAFGGSEKIPDNFPADIPTYTNAKVLASMLMGPLSMVTFETTDSLSAVGDFYKDKLVTSGWQSIYASAPTPEVFSGMFKKDNRQLSVSVTNNDGKTSIVLTYGLEQQ